MRLVFAVAAAAMVAGCQEVTILRADGQRIPSNPALIAQADLDRAICKGEMDKAGMQANPTGRGMASVFDGCMASRGYFVVPKEQVETRRAAIQAARR